MSTLEFDASLLSDTQIRNMLVRLGIAFEWSTSAHAAPRYDAVQAIMRAAEAAHARHSAARKAYLDSDIVTQEIQDELLSSETEWAKFTKRA